MNDKLATLWHEARRSRVLGAFVAIALANGLEASIGLFGVRLEMLWCILEIALALVGIGAYFADRQDARLKPTVPPSTGE